MRSPTTIHTYVLLRQLAKTFASDRRDPLKRVHSLVVSGPPGVGKSETLRRALKDEYLNQT
jgi:DNA replication protein DnaC